jgi:hypothetical protein
MDLALRQQAGALALISAKQILGGDLLPERRPVRRAGS